MGVLCQDIGCCFGQETRKLIVDGFPEANIIVSDITPDYWRAPCLHAIAGAGEQSYTRCSRGVARTCMAEADLTA